MNTVEKSQQLIDKVCEYYKVESKGLYDKREKRPVRMTKMVIDDKKVKVDISCLRMALAYYILLYTDIPQAIIGPLVGYADHTTVSYAKRKVRAFFDTNDEIFLSYWNTVDNIANSLSFKTDMQRVMDTYFIRMTTISH
jgi:chromosomal replication initiation ATPase DnaA